jgi:hypothetical protein
MAGGAPIRRAGPCCSSIRGRVTAGRRAPGWPSGRAKRGSRPSSWLRARTGRAGPGSRGGQRGCARDGRRRRVAGGRGRSGGWARDPVCMHSGRDAQPLRARHGGGPARRSAAGNSGSSSSTRPATARALWGEPGARRAWRSVLPNQSTPELTARRWNSARRCSSLSSRRRCGSGSPHATRAPRHQRACASQATQLDLTAGEN